jgi:hypothetical protein
MQTQTKVSRILFYEGAGFLVIIALSWFSEFSDLPRLAGVNQYVPNWRESALETFIVLLVAIPVLTLTKRLATRLYYLEGFLRVCAWCKKLENNGKWIPLEEFFESKFQTAASHSICGVCMEELKTKTRNPYSA